MSNKSNKSNRSNRSNRKIKDNKENVTNNQFVKSKENENDSRINQARSKTRNKIFLPINLFRIFVALAVMSLSLLVLFGDFTGLQSMQLNLVNQVLLSLLLLVNGITALKDRNKPKKGTAYASLLAGIFILGLSVVTFLKITSNV